MTRPDRREAGFTLIELMISLVLFSFAIIGVMSIAVTMTRAFREQRRIVATENAVRAPLDFVIDAVRGASPGVPTGTIKDAESCRSGAILLTDNTAAPDELEVVYASGSIVTTTYTAFANNSSSITIPAAHAGQFAAGDFALVTDSTQGTLVKITGTTATTLLVNPSCPTAFPTGGYAAGSILIRAQRARFSVAPLDGIPTLWMDPDGPQGSAAAEPVAEGIEDMQVAVGYDVDGSGTLTDATSTTDEWQGNAVGDTALTGSIRAVRVVLTARETTELMGTAAFYRPAALNHDATTSPDKYRRRVLSSTVEIRNLQGSP